MTTHAYDKEITALLVIDPYNDFISEGGKAWPGIRAVAEANGCVPHMLRVLNAAREAELRISMLHASPTITKPRPTGQGPAEYFSMSMQDSSVSVCKCPHPGAQGDQ